MKKYYNIFIFGSVLLFAAGHAYVKKQDQTVINRQTVVLEHDIYDEFGSFIFKDLDDNINRVIMYDGNEYNYIEIGDTLTLSMTNGTFRKEYNKHNMMFPEELTIDPGEKLKQKNKMLEKDSLTIARRKLLRKQLEENPIQIVASKAECIQK